MITNRISTLPETSMKLKVMQETIIIMLSLMTDFKNILVIGTVFSPVYAVLLNSPVPSLKKPKKTFFGGWCRNASSSSWTATTHYRHTVPPP